MASTDYEKGIKILKKATVPKIKLYKNAVNLLSYIVSDLNGRLVTKTKEEYKTGHKQRHPDMWYKFAQRAVKKVLGTKLNDFACSEGQKNVLKFQNKMIRYQEQSVVDAFMREIERKSLNKPKRPEIVGQEFRKGLKDMAKSIHQNRKLDTSSKNYMAQLMFHITLAMANHSKSVVVHGKNIGENEMNETISDFLPPLLLEHARAEGAKSVSMYHRGELDIPNIAEEKEEMRIKLIKRKRRKKTRRTEEHEVIHDAFDAGIKRLAKEVRNSCKLDHESLHIMNDELEVLAKVFASKICETAKNEQTPITASTVQSTMQSILPTELALYATAEGTKALALYSDGILKLPVPRGLKRKQSDISILSAPAKKRKIAHHHHNIEKKKKKRKRIRSNKKTTLDFIQCGLALLREINQIASMDRAAGMFLNEVLLDVFKNLISTCRQEESTKDVTVEAIKNSVELVLTGQLKNHAVAAGDIAVSMVEHEDGYDSGKHGKIGHIIREWMGIRPSSSEYSDFEHEDFEEGKKRSKKKWLCFRK